MNANDCLEQKGIIEDISDSTIKIRVQPLSACDNCQTKSLCNIKGNRDNLIELTDKSGSFSVGEIVNLMVEKSAGYRALFLGYLLPLIIVLVSIVVLLIAGLSEIIAGTASLLMLVPYYLILYSLRHIIKKKIKISFTKSQPL
jgi:sigma-E factor negative regulatory protein RseC